MNVSLITSATIKMPNVFGSNMVLQGEKPVPIWGWAKANSVVNVSFKGIKRAITSDFSGYWIVSLPALTASATPSEMKITAESDTITLSNILVGEVWICSGQSNMRYAIKNTYQKPAKTADSLELELSVKQPQIRLLFIQNKFHVTDAVTTGWHMAEGAELGNFSAIGYFFAKNLQRKLNIPIGVICSAVNGTQIEPWTPAAAYMNNPMLKDKMEAGNKINGVEAGSIYDSMIKPLAPFAIRGFLWYQGESNAITNDTLYSDKLKTLINSWRQAWGIKDLPFYYVSIAPFNYTRRKDKVTHTAQTLPLIWEAQNTALSLPNTEIVPTSDLIDKINDLHPPYKWVVGTRLSNVALAKQYGYKNIEFTGPRFKEMKANGKEIIVTFTHAENLKTNDGQYVKWLELAGADGVFKPAIGIIKQNRLVVTSAEVDKPVQIRMGWHETAQPNLINQAGLPALIFRASAK